MIVELNQPLRALPFDARVYVADHTRRLVLMYPARLLADRPNDLYVDTGAPFPDPSTAVCRIIWRHGRRVADMAREAWGLYPGTDSEGWGFDDWWGNVREAVAHDRPVAAASAAYVARRHLMGWAHFTTLLTPTDRVRIINETHMEHPHD